MTKKEREKRLEERLEEKNYIADKVLEFGLMLEHDLVITPGKITIEYRSGVLNTRGRPFTYTLK